MTAGAKLFSPGQSSDACVARAKVSLRGEMRTGASSVYLVDAGDIVEVLDHGHQSKSVLCVRIDGRCHQ